MPLSKKRMRERKRQDRAGVKPKSNLNIGTLVKPNQEKLVELRQLIESKSSPVEEETNSKLPLYNPQIHGPSDRVLIKSPYRKKLVEIVIPELDAGGQPITDYS